MTANDTPSPVEQQPPEETLKKEEADGSLSESEDENNVGVASLPAVEDLSKDSDFTPFLAEGVPDELTRAALRKLWHSDPEFAHLDGLNDYDEDFSIFKGIASAVTEILSTLHEEAETKDASVSDEESATGDAAGQEVSDLPPEIDDVENNEGPSKPISPPMPAQQNKTNE